MASVVRACDYVVKSDYKDRVGLLKVPESMSMLG